ncbi:MAG: DUF1572 family protein [Caldilineaceae bacterium]
MGPLARIDDPVFFAVLDPEANSIAILVKHMAGNMRSRWRDFLTSDGEKPDRDRDSEFIITPADTRPRSWPAGKRAGSSCSTRWNRWRAPIYCVR